MAKKKTAVNPVRWVEIPVTDLKRAKTFYSKTLDLKYQDHKQDEYEMALIQADPDTFGTGGGLIKGPTYVPSYDGTVVYFGTDDIEGVLKKVENAGGKIVAPRKSIGQFGFVAYFEDTEGNRIALHSMEKAKSK
jgi:predicted enzyme related to lactoylglutathione lyase